MEMNDEAKEISDLILKKVSKNSCIVIPSPNDVSMSIYNENTGSFIMKIERFENEISIIDQYHAFRFNFGSDKESTDAIWNTILDNLNLKNL